MINWFKYKAVLIKELKLLLNDKMGLALMFLMPIILVFIMTFVQDVTQRNTAGNTITLLIDNQNNTRINKKIISALNETKSFKLTVINKKISTKTFKNKLIQDDIDLGLVLNKELEDQLKKLSASSSSALLKEFGFETTTVLAHQHFPEIELYYNPTLQNNYRIAISRGIVSLFQGIQNELMLEDVFEQLGENKIPSQLRQQLFDAKPTVQFTAASTKAFGEEPNATQHSVPAWSIFALFFMVVSLGGNIVRERENGSFIRLLTIPNSYHLVLRSKLLLYFCVASLQMITIFLIGMFIFPLIDLPELKIPENFIGLSITCTLTCLCAVAYAFMVGMIAKTQEQANGFGAVSILLFAAIGGIWIPQFAMPSFMRTIAMASPLNWCLEGFYDILLYNGEYFTRTLSIIGYQLIFIVGCLMISYWRLNKIVTGSK